MALSTHLGFLKTIKLLVILFIIKLHSRNNIFKQKSLTCNICILQIFSWNLVSLENLIMLTVCKKESRFDDNYNLSWLSSLSKVFIFRKQQSTHYCSLPIAETLQSAVDKRGHFVTFTRHILDKGRMGISIFLRKN